MNTTLIKMFFYIQSLNKSLGKSWVHVHITSKQIELEGPDCSGFEGYLMSFET